MPELSKIAKIITLHYKFSSNEGVDDFYPIQEYAFIKIQI